MKLFRAARNILRVFLLVFVALPLFLLCIFTAWTFLDPTPPPDKLIVNDVTKLNPIAVSGMVTPLSNEDVQDAVKTHPGPISIGGGRFSMGGQIGTDKTLFIDMSRMNKIVDFKLNDKLITVQAGARWKDVQDYIDPYDLSVEIMQTYDNFTVGGSLSVNVHGRYIGLGPMILSVRSIKLVLADGRLVEASRTQDPELFYGAIGGYGGLGVITEATLELADNVTIKRFTQTMPIVDYRKYFLEKVRDADGAVFHNADIYPPEYDNLTAVTWFKTNEAVTSAEHFKPVKDSYWLENIFYYWITHLPYGLTVREKFIDPLLYRSPAVVKRNYEASYDVKELMPLNRGSATYVLQEYFVPIERFDDFVPKMRKILQDHHVNMVNVSIRHAKADPGSILAWARQEVFCFVMYYQQGTSVEDRDAVGLWTREMIDAALSVGGRYYLPYQPYATQNQFQAAYPDAEKFFALKKKYDPDYKFRNKLWDKYYWPDAHERDIRQQAEDTAHYYRTEDQTFLTIPEWHIVFSSEEYAAALKHRPSEFPYFASIAQYWSIYRRIRQRTESEYPPNPSYNLMVRVIGISTAAELGVKGVYENTIGRLTEWVSDRRDLTPDMKVESFMQDTESEYVAFVRQRPWYEFPFLSKYESLTTVQESPGVNGIRSWERRFFFGSELLFKSVYAWAIESASHATYELADDKTWTIISQNGAEQIVDLPRYQNFTAAAVAVSENNGRFVDIAGNKKILLTVIAPENWSYHGEGEVFTEWPILTQPEKKRSALLLNVGDLAPFLRDAVDDKAITLDHIFDY